MSTPEQERGAWGSRVGFVLAAAGSAVGLGNIWKFPYIAGENGGGLFVLIYLGCIALVGLPILIAEIMIGRAAQKQPVGAFASLEKKKTSWTGVGWLGVLSGFLILSFYAVVAGWALDYTLKSVVNFTKPIAEEAQLGAAEYVVTTPIEEMRDRLVSVRASHQSHDEVTGIRAEAPKSVWAEHKRFQAALSKADDAAQAREILLADPDAAAAVERAEALVERIDAAKAKASEEAVAHYESVSDEDVRAEALVEHRRKLISARVQETFVGLATDGWTSAFWAALFMLMTILVVSAGVSGGIEKWCKVLMPLLFAIIVVMVVYGATTRGFGQAAAFVFKPDPSRLHASGVLEALGHAFFTLSLGMGAMITYGSYQTSKEKLVGQATVIAGLDTVIALLACLMMFPIVFSYGQDASAGPGLVFMSMPLAFAEIGPGGMLLSIMFFGLLVFAALTSAISLLEVVVSYFIDEKGWSRRRAAWVFGGVILLLGMPSAFAMDEGGLFKSWESGYGANFFDTADYLSSNWMLPLGGLLISVYAGWIMPRRIQEAELADSSKTMMVAWLWLVRVVAPVLVILVLLQKVGLIDVT